MMDAVDEEALQLRRSEFEVLRTVPWWCPRKGWRRKLRSLLGMSQGWMEGEVEVDGVFVGFLLDPLGIF